METRRAHGPGRGGMAMAEQTVAIKAPAKINLFLEVLGERADGYHDIRSLLVPLALHDVLELALTDGEIETTIEGTVRVDPAEDLAARAARLLKRATGFAGGLRIRLRKTIPVGGGLGGGSSDAAAVLRAANRLWRTGLSTAELLALGAQLGADVPGLVQGGAVCVEGRGERVRPAPVQPSTTSRAWWIVLVNPGFVVSTKDIYSRYKPHLTSDPEAFKIALYAWESGSLDLAAKSLFNALQETVFTKYPLIELIAGELAGAGAQGVLLSGTGATLFALAADRAHALQVQRQVRERMSYPLWTRVTSVSRRPSGEEACAAG